MFAIRFATFLFRGTGKVVELADINEATVAINENGFIMDLIRLFFGFYIEKRIEKWYNNGTLQMAAMIRKV